MPESNKALRLVQSGLVSVTPKTTNEAANMATTTSTADIGLIGLAVMGENLVLNMESHGYTVAVFNRTTSKVDAFVAGRARG